MAELLRSEFIENIRDWMRDKDTVNRLLAGEESHDNTIILCIQNAMYDWNSVPPTSILVISSTASGATDQLLNIPDNTIALYMDFVVIRLLTSILFARMRNRLSYADGNVTVDDEGSQIQGYIQLLQMLKGEGKEKLVNIKTAANLGQLMNSPGIPSEYSLLETTSYFERSN